MAKLIGNQPFHAVKVDAVRHDCGDRLGYVKATIALALERPDLAHEVSGFIASLRA
jgi:UTP--glucose-1-phosphate uridylyltransferase